MKTCPCKVEIFSAVKIESFYRIILIILIFLLAEAPQSMFWSNNKEICITLFPRFQYVKVGLKWDSIVLDCEFLHWLYMQCLKLIVSLFNSKNFALEKEQSHE